MLEVKKHPPSGTIILNRPDCRNALSRVLVEELKQAFSDFHQEKGVRAVILTGNGTAFCSGFDLREIQTSRSPTPISAGGLADSMQALETWHQDVSSMRELVQTILHYPKPIISAVNGPAAGMGAALALASDIVVGSPEASLSFPEVRRGLAPGLVAPLLAFRVGAGLAAPLLLSGQAVDADTCYARGLFHELTPHDTLWARAHALAEQCAESAAESLQMTKQLLNETIGDSLRTSLATGAALSATARTTEASIEGVDAFLDKRPPQWP